MVFCIENHPIKKSIKRYLLHGLPCLSDFVLFDFHNYAHIMQQYLKSSPIIIMFHLMVHFNRVKDLHPKHIAELFYGSFQPAISSMRHEDQIYWYKTNALDSQIMLRNNYNGQFQFLDY